MASNNNALYFLLGSALGVALGLFLQSDEGKKVRTRAAEKLKDLESQVEGKVQDALEKLKKAN